MGVLDKFLDAIKINEDDDEEYLDENMLDDEEEDFLDEEEDMDEKPKKKFFEKFSKHVSDGDSDEFDLDEDEPVKPASKATVKPAPAKASQKQERVSRPAASSKITPMRSSKRSAAQNLNMEVCVIKPSSMEDTREIADTLIENSTVILNLEGLDMELAQRIIDFTSGACYSLGGSLQKVSSYIFVLGPYNVDITGDLQNILGGSVPSVRAGY
jgi:cell division inhibitor SepF